MVDGVRRSDHGANLHGFGLVLQFLHQSRLANAGLALDDHHGISIVVRQDLKPTY